MIVAGHFSHLIGVYDLEGCVRQGFLSRLKTMNWNQSVAIPTDAIRRADHRLLLLGLILWISSHFLYLIVVLVVIIALIAWRWRIHKMKRKLSTLVLDEPVEKHGSEVADRSVMTPAEECSDLD